jgi:imidazolonepropionase-like amidohydrolase
MELDSAAEIIGSATITNAAFLMQEGKLGTIDAGAPIVDGDPFTDLCVMLDLEKSLKVIIKDSVVYKNALT